MFNTNRLTAQIANLNLRIEKHGTERVLAADLKLAMKIGSDDLNDIEPGLRESLFRRPAAGDQLRLVEENEPGAYTVLKHPVLEPLKLKQKLPGYELEILPLGAAEGEEGFFLANVELKRFTIEPHDGGSVSLTVTASAEIESEDGSELLELLQREDCLATLTAPKRAAQEPQPEDLAA